MGKENRNLKEELDYINDIDFVPELIYSAVKNAIGDFNLWCTIQNSRDSDLLFKHLNYFREKYDLDLRFGASAKKLSAKIFGDFDK